MYLKRHACMFVWRRGSTCKTKSLLNKNEIKGSFDYSFLREKRHKIGNVYY